jgi:rRNA maturation endonuclease Nob1
VLLASRADAVENDGGKAVLRVACGACAILNDTDAKFCKSCGAKLAGETGMA